MKHILKFNESKSAITSGDVEKIENIYLDWIDDDRLIVGKAKNSVEVVIDLLNKNGPASHEDTHPSYKLQYDLITLGIVIDATKECDEIMKLCYEQKKSDKLSPNIIDFSMEQEFIISNKQDVDDLFTNMNKKIIPPENSNLYRRFYIKLLNFLDQHYNVKEQLYELLAKMNSLTYYGFKTNNSLHSNPPGESSSTKETDLVLCIAFELYKFNFNRVDDLDTYAGLEVRMNIEKI